MQAAERQVAIYIEAGRTVLELFNPAEGTVGRGGGHSEAGPTAVFQRRGDPMRVDAESIVSLAAARRLGPVDS